MLHYLRYGKQKVNLLQAMKHLHDKVNVIPVIGKSDACTQDEIRRFKSAVSFSKEWQIFNVFTNPFRGNWSHEVFSACMKIL